MLQRFLNVPATPSLCAAEGGVVLDRVVASLGGASFWANATARLRAQAAWDSAHTREGKPHRALAEAGVYGLALRARAVLPADSLLRASAQLDSLARWLPGPAAGERAPLRARVSLLSAGLLHGHNVAAEALWHARAAAPAGGYVDVPRAAALSVASRRRGPLRYRVGLATGEAAAGAEGPPAFPPLRAQAGAELGGSLTLRARGRGGEAPRGFLLLPQRTRVTLAASAGALGRAPLRAAGAAAPPRAGGAGGAASALEALRGQAAAWGAEGLAFASLSLGLSLGAFCKPLLDCTQLTLRCEAARGSGSLQRLRAPPAPGAAAAPLGALLSASLCQQLLGPVRLRADLRLPAQAAAAWLRAAGTPGAAAAREGLEAVYSLDVALPPVQGAARVVAWYCPQRNEAFAELRLLDM